MDVLNRKSLLLAAALCMSGAALAQNAVDKPALFQLKHLVGKGPALIFCDRHTVPIIRWNGSWKFRSCAVSVKTEAHLNASGASLWFAIAVLAGREPPGSGVLPFGHALNAT